MRACYVIEASEEEAALAIEDEGNHAEAALGIGDESDPCELLSDSGNSALEFEEAAESVVDACAPAADGAVAPAPPAAADESASTPPPPAVAAGSAVAPALPAAAPIVPAGAAAAIGARLEHDLTIKNWHGSLGSYHCGWRRSRVGSASGRLVWEGA